MSKLLLLSNSTMPGTPFFSWPKQYVQHFLGSEIGQGVFIPFAAVALSFNEYATSVEQAFAEMNYSLKSIHIFSDKMKAIEEASFIAIGGGNSFALLSRMYEFDLLEMVRQKVLSGTPYIGWSAGSNLACPTIMTTNDMPIIQPPSLKALNLVPFQINPHYHELKFEGQGGETRRERLEEFLLLNPGKSVVGLPEGMLIEKDNSTLRLQGFGLAKFYDGNTVKEIESGTDTSLYFQ